MLTKNKKNPCVGWGVGVAEKGKTRKNRRGGDTRSKLGKGLWPGRRRERNTAMDRVMKMRKKAKRRRGKVPERKQKRRDSKSETNDAIASGQLQPHKIF